MLDDLTIYVTLFVNAFIAATLFPALSELTFAALLSGNIGHPLILLIAVSTGNILGSVVNWVLGRFIISQNKLKQKYSIKPAYIRAKKFFSRFGLYSLLFAWLPIIGDPITFIAGIFRVRFMPFIILVSIGKITRYAIILFVFQTAIDT